MLIITRTGSIDEKDNDQASSKDRAVQNQEETIQKTLEKLNRHPRKTKTPVNLEIFGQVILGDKECMESSGKSPFKLMPKGGNRGCINPWLLTEYENTVGTPYASNNMPMNSRVRYSDVDNYPSARSYDNSGDLQRKRHEDLFLMRTYSYRLLRHINLRLSVRHMSNLVWTWFGKLVAKDLPERGTPIPVFVWLLDRLGTPTLVCVRSCPNLVLQLVGPLALGIVTPLGSGVEELETDVDLVEEKDED
ncbi:hypothetical protein Tco_0742933, partial [Tanacetum coccineum]